MNRNVDSMSRPDLKVQAPSVPFSSLDNCMIAYLYQPWTLERVCSPYMDAHIVHRIRLRHSLGKAASKYSSKICTLVHHETPASHSIHLKLSGYFVALTWSNEDSISCLLSFWQLGLERMLIKATSIRRTRTTRILTKLYIGIAQSSTTSISPMVAMQAIRHIPSDRLQTACWDMRVKRLMQTWQQLAGFSAYFPQYWVWQDLALSSMGLLHNAARSLLFCYPLDQRQWLRCAHMNTAGLSNCSDPKALPQLRQHHLLSLLQSSAPSLRLSTSWLWERLWT